MNDSHCSPAYYSAAIVVGDPLKQQWLLVDRTIFGIEVVVEGDGSGSV
jgi:hypothetical protein